LSFARRICDAYSFALVATPTPIQAQAFSLLAIVEGGGHLVEGAGGEVARQALEAIRPSCSE
jgi:hypothetical protein